MVLNKIFNKRRGVELTINTVIIMALTLLVLGIMIYLIIGAANKGIEYNKCEDAHGGTCVEKGSECINSDKPVIGPYSCPTKEKPYCCINFGVGGTEDAKTDTTK